MGTMLLSCRMDGLLCSLTLGLLCSLTLVAG